ncbi:unnamed protein product [Sphenostylis stenocarpa]|uniref:Uncharacterized protein n=1 Tax=Sphenostylis stenocarpa TaxID=92480 RepID=A0AA86VLZ3_9FABA|nr:unnamed protein product [Sphenostylis stenocarpa]
MISKQKIITRGKEKENYANKVFSAHVIRSQFERGSYLSSLILSLGQWLNQNLSVRSLMLGKRKMIVFLYEDKLIGILS